MTSSMVMAANHAEDLAARMEKVSAPLLGHRYLLDPFGEGESGKYDRDPLYRFDAFDCTTFVETVMALTLSQDHESFYKVLMQIRYKNGEISYTTRNHFPETDWLPNNARAGFIRDITTEIAGERNVDIARAIIDKRGWYEHMTAEKINVPNLTQQEREELLRQLKTEGKPYATELSELPYIHLHTLFDRKGSPNQELFNKIPAGTIVNIVRPNWDVVDREGTHLNVSHQALLIKKNGTLYIRHATTGNFNRVVDQPLVEYLHGLIDHPTIKGINLQALLN